MRTFICDFESSLVDLNGDLFVCEGWGRGREAKEFVERREFERMDETHYLVMERLEIMIDLKIPEIYISLYSIGLINGVAFG
jgi:hypothetical protein